MAASICLPYRVRYASGRDKCICGTQITKGTIQLAIIEQSLTDDCMEPKWYEQDCFFKYRRPATEALIDGFANLRMVHQIEIRQLLDKSQDSEPPKKKQRTENTVASVVLEDATVKQNKEFFEIRGKLKFNTKREDRIAILTANNQYIPEGNTEILNHLADILYFGALEPCSLCEGQFVFKDSIYCCTGNISEWSKCVNTVKTPSRTPVQIPEKYQIFLRGNFKIRDRILNDIQKIDDEDFTLCVKQPLFGMEFMIVGETTKPKDEIENKIKRMGGKVTEKIHENIAAVISNPDEVLKMGSAMEEAKTHGIQIVPETFIENLKNNDPLEFMVNCDLSNWGQDPKIRLPQIQPSDTGIFDPPSTSTGAVSKGQGMKWKFGGVVDPDSHLQNIAHVFIVGEVTYNAILDLVDAAANKNSYFKMQLLESDTEEKYWLFQSKGRIATTIGSFDIKPMPTLFEAIAAFKRIYFEKTGNEFGTKEFIKKPGKYNQMTICHEQLIGTVSGCRQRIEYSAATTNLSESLYNLIDLVFDVDVMQSTMISFDLDLNKMPMGKISSAQIESATLVLKEIERLSSCKQKSNDASAKGITDATNKFYSLIPHNFGVNRPPLLNTRQLINQKYGMLSDMQQMDITYNILVEDHDVNVNVIDRYYRKLRGVVEITDLDKQCDEYNEIQTYVTNTDLSGRGEFPIELLDVFKILRREEIGRFAPFEQTPNRKLLFHGTKVTNVVGILTNGLQLPERSGMLGKGIYFSDSVSKSIDYCQALSQSFFSSHGLLVLCEVALGQCESGTRNRTFHRATYPNVDSLHVRGAYSPSTNHVRPDGLIVPNGVLEYRDNGIDLHLRFNEYAVYDESRIKIRYILKVKYGINPVNVPILPFLPNLRINFLARNLLVARNRRNAINPPNNRPPQ